MAHRSRSVRGVDESAPRSSEEQEVPEAERPATPAEEARVSNRDLEDPPQAEGDRDQSAEER